MSLDPGNLIALFATALFIVIFLSLAISTLVRVRTPEGYHFVNYEMETGILFRSLTAGTTSLATVVFWLLLNAKAFGAIFVVTGYPVNSA